MQEYVQMFTRTTFLSSSAAVSGCELSHVVAPAREDNSPLASDRVLAEAIAPKCAAAIVMAAVPKKRRRLRLMSLRIDGLRFLDLSSSQDTSRHLCCSCLRVIVVPSHKLRTSEPLNWPA